MIAFGIMIAIHNYICTIPSSTISTRFLKLKKLGNLKLKRPQEKSKKFIYPREDIILKAREESKKEVEDYANKSLIEMNEHKLKIDATKVSMDFMEKKLKQETTELKNLFDLHKEEVISFLMDNIFCVDVSVSDVVRGKFSEKLKN